VTTRRWLALQRPDCIAHCAGASSALTLEYAVGPHWWKRRPQAVLRGGGQREGNSRNLVLVGFDSSPGHAPGAPPSHTRVVWSPMTPQALPDTGALPLIEAAIAGRAAAKTELERQMPPRDPRVQHKQNPSSLADTPRLGCPGILLPMVWLP